MHKVAGQQELYCFRKKASIISSSPSEHGQYIEYILTVLEEVNSKINRLNSDWEKKFSDLVAEIRTKSDVGADALILKVEEKYESLANEIHRLSEQFKVMYCIKHR